MEAMIMIRDNEPHKITVPEKPTLCINCATHPETLIKSEHGSCYESQTKYQAALDRAFEEGVKFEEPSLVRDMIRQDCWAKDLPEELKEHTVYHVSLPDYKEVRQWRFNDSTIHPWRDIPNHQHRLEDNVDYRTILRFIPQEPAEEKGNGNNQTSRFEKDRTIGLPEDITLDKDKISKEEGSDGEEEYGPPFTYEENKIRESIAGIVAGWLDSGNQSIEPLLDNIVCNDFSALSS